jgi:hypothetical protein
MITRIRHSTTGLLLVVVLAAGLAPRPALARGGASDEERPLRLSASAMAGPIGVVAPNSALRHRVTINGRETSGEQLIWGGELLQTPAGRGTSIRFDSAGRATLGGGSVARFAARPSGGGGGPVLVASVIAGDVTLRLNPDAGAYVEAAGSAFTASGGASFRVGVREGRPVLETLSGTVHEQQQPAAQRRYVLRPVGSGSTISVRTRSTRQLQIQVTDENDRSVPDLPILFLLAGGGGQGAGSLGAGGASATVTTNAQGIASITYTAPAQAGQESITATAQGTRFSHTWEVTVAAAGTGFWSPRNSLIVAGIVGGATTAIVVSTGGDNEEAIMPLPPPQVRPTQARR